jgi:VWFA-related protein
VIVTGPALVASLLVGAGQTPPRFEVAVQVVHLDVFVSRGGRPVSELSAANFAVNDNGVRQQVRLVERSQVVAAVVLVLDTSASVAGEPLRELRAAGHAILGRLSPEDQAALITFDFSPHLHVDLTSDLPSVGRALDAVTAQGSTVLYDGLYAGLTLPPSGTRVRPIIVLFTDGEDNRSWLGPEQLLEHAMRSSAVVQVVGLKEPPPRRGERGLANASNRSTRARRWLRRIAGETGGQYREAESIKQVRDAFLSILDEMGTRYVLAFEPTGVEREGVHELEVRLENAKGNVRARRRYVIPASP